MCSEPLDGGAAAGRCGMPQANAPDNNTLRVACGTAFILHVNRLAGWLRYPGHVRVLSSTGDTVPSVRRGLSLCDGGPVPLHAGAGGTHPSRHGTSVLPSRQSLWPLHAGGCRADRGGAQEGRGAGGAGRGLCAGVRAAGGGAGTGREGGASCGRGAVPGAGSAGPREGGAAGSKRDPLHQFGEVFQRRALAVPLAV